MNSKQFLLFGGVVLLVLGLCGLTFLGPTPEESILGQFNWFDETENMAHLFLGGLMLGAYFFVKDPQFLKWLVMLVGVMALVATVAGFLGMGNPVPNAGVTNLEMSDNILHLILAVWAFATATVETEKTD